jgi:P pilus assembly chaperone PapD
MNKSSIFNKIALSLMVFSTFFTQTDAAGLAIDSMEQFILPNQSATYIISNKLEAAIAVEVILESWRISEGGEEIRELTQDLVAYPSQFILKGNMFKRIKVGLREVLKRVDLEKCYRVTIRELPINLEGDKPGTYIIYNASAYRTSFYILPPEPVPHIEIVDCKINNTQLTLAFQNTGNVHIHLRNPLLLLKMQNGEEVEITNHETLKPISGENMHGMSMRHFTINLSEENLSSSITAVEVRFLDKGFLEKDRFSWKF